MNKDIYFDYNPWWEGDLKLKNIIERPLFIKKMEEVFKSKSVVFLTGLRRIGKTTLLKLFINRIIEKGIDPGHIFYVSLDDYLLRGKTIIEIVNEFRKIQKIRKEEMVYLFLDEVASVEHFHQQLKNLYDKYNLKIYAASSSSSILKDRKAFLTGREYIIEVLPLDFEEYLLFNNLQFSKRDSHLKGSYFEDFLKTGGVPEFVLNNERGYLQSLVSDIIYKDIIAFNKIKNHQLVEDFFQLLISHTCGPLSIYKISNVLKVSTETVSRYLRYFIDTYLIYKTPRSGKKNLSLNSPCKVYASDIGIRYVFTGSFKIGKQFENYLYLKIKNYSPRYVYENQTEIDFFIKDSVLIESKFEGELSKNQEKLFNKIKADKKFVVKDFKDLVILEDYLEKKNKR